jgi:hypothetical protein
MSGSGRTATPICCASWPSPATPSFVVMDDVQTGRLQPLLVDHRPVEFAINAFYPHRHHRPPGGPLRHRRRMNPGAAGGDE